jgi:hypothetical protein
MFTAFNLRRLMNIIDKNAFKKFLSELASLFYSKTAFIEVIFSPITAILFSATFY